MNASQPTDARGRVNAKVRHDLLYLTVDVPDGDELLHWAATPHKPLPGEVVFYSATQLVALETIAFTAGACVGYQEQFASGAGSDGAYVCQLAIAAPAFEMRAGGAPPAPAVAAKAKDAAATVAAAAATAEAAATAPATAASAVILPKGLPSLPKGFVAEYSQAEFAKTIGGAQHMKPPEVIEQLYHLFNAASAASVPGQPSLTHWKAVENLMRSSHYVDPKDGKEYPLNGHWPPGHGGYQRQTVQLKKGDTYDRYQGSVFDKTENPLTGKFDVDHVTGDVFDVTFRGNFVSAKGKTAQSFASRALDKVEDKYFFKYDIEVLQDVPTDAVRVESANVIPWYGQPGGGTQHRLLFPKVHC